VVYSLRFFCFTEFVEYIVTIFSFRLAAEMGYIFMVFQPGWRLAVFSVLQHP